MATKHKKALITGITGQDGSYLADLLLAKGYEVHGMVRRSSSIDRSRLAHLETHRTSAQPSLYLHYGDLADSGNLINILHQVRPDEIYNLAGQSSVHVSFEMPEYTSECNGLAVVRLLEAIVKSGLGGEIKFYQASTSEIYGNALCLPITESTPICPVSPYGASKNFAHNITAYYRKAFGLFACCGILFNHESPRRSETFISRKITRAVGRIKYGLLDKIRLGDLNPKRDWGYAPEYVEAMWLMLQADNCDDYIVATNASHSVGDLVSSAFSAAGLDWRRYVEFDQRQIRGSEIQETRGHALKIQRKLGWEPRVGFTKLIEIMVDHDLRLAKAEAVNGI
jgi:GDPmannose 4,6-dehydratase